MDNILQKHPYAGVIILGDFNALNDKSLRNYPLKQTVTKPTRDVAILDKIYALIIADWYSQSLILPNISTSNHQVVVFSPEHTQGSFKHHNINVSARNNSMNGRILLAHELANFDWSYILSRKQTLTPKQRILTTAYNVAILDNNTMFTR